MAETENRVKTEFVVSDKATKAMETMTGAAGKLSRGLESVQGAFAGILGAAGLATAGLSMESIYQSTVEHYEAVRNIVDVTGMAAEKADGLREAMDQSLIPAEEAERIIMRMSRAGERAEMAMQGFAGAGRTGASQMTQLGVDISKGPEAAIMQLSAKAKAGKIDMNQLSMAFQLRPEMAKDFERMLKQGPEAIKKTMEEAKKYAVNDDDLRVYNEMLHAQKGVTAMWDHIKTVIGKELFPLITSMLKDIKSHEDKWVNAAKKFGAVLHFVFTDGLATAKAITKVLLVNIALQKFTGTGIVGNLGRVEKAFFPAGMTAAVSSHKAMRLARGLIGRNNPLAGAGIAASPQAVTSLTKMFMTIGKVAPAASGLLKLGIVGVLIDRVVAGIMSLANNADAMFSFVTEPFDKLRASLGPIEDMFENIFGHDGTLGPESVFGQLWTNIIPMALSGAIDMIRYVIEGISAFFGLLGQEVGDLIEAGRELSHGHLGKAAELLNDAYNPVNNAKNFAAIFSQLDRDAVKRAAATEKARAAAKHAGGDTPDKRQQAPSFPNARFNITMEFAEGTDPDRIATVFAQKISKMGQRRTGSSYSPVG